MVELQRSVEALQAAQNERDEKLESALYELTAAISLAGLTGAPASQRLAAHPLHLVGSGLNETVRGFGKGLADVRMVRWVPEVAPYFHHARIAVVPLLHGAGTKRKMLQALLSGACSSILIRALGKCGRSWGWPRSLAGTMRM